MSLAPWRSGLCSHCALLKAHPSIAALLSGPHTRVTKMAGSRPDRTRAPSAPDAQAGSLHRFFLYEHIIVACLSLRPPHLLEPSPPYPAAPACTLWESPLGDQHRRPSQGQIPPLPHRAPATASPPPVASHPCLYITKVGGNVHCHKKKNAVNPWRAPGCITITLGCPFA